MPLLLLYASLYLSLSDSLAQARHDWILWPAAGIQIGFKESPFRGEFTLQNRFHQHASRFRLLVGTAHLHYQTKIKGLFLASGYATGVIYGVSKLQLLQAFAYYQAELHKVSPVLRLTYDYLWLTPFQRGDLLTRGNHRVRLLAGIGPALAKNYHLILSAEPFILRQRALLSESRMQIGLRRKLSSKVTIDLLYFNRWQQPLSQDQVHRWEHALIVFLHYSLNSRSVHIFHGR